MDGLSGGEGNGATMWDGTDVETATARAEDDGARVMRRRSQGERFCAIPGAQGGFGRGVACGRPVGRASGETATNGVSRGGDGGDGIPINNSKFQSLVRKHSFSPSSWP